MQVCSIIKHRANGRRYCDEEDDDDVFKGHGTNVLHISRKQVMWSYKIAFLGFEHEPSSKIMNAFSSRAATNSPVTLVGYGH